jgi:hypothetical protein
MSEKIRPQHLERKAILYVRQSSPYQVLHNLESQKLQYAMEERLRHLGWRAIEVVDEDLGRSAAGLVTRAGFERMVAEVCLGKVGAVAAREVSRFEPGLTTFASDRRTDRAAQCGDRSGSGYLGRGLAPTRQPTGVDLDRFRHQCVAEEAHCAYAHRRSPGRHRQLAGRTHPHASLEGRRAYRTAPASPSSRSVQYTDIARVDRRDHGFGAHRKRRYDRQRAEPQRSPYRTRQPLDTRE